MDSKPTTISALGDVNLSSPQDNHLLAYDTATVAFENKSIATLNLATLDDVVAQSIALG